MTALQRLTALDARLTALDYDPRDRRADVKATKQAALVLGGDLVGGVAGGYAAQALFPKTKSALPVIVGTTIGGSVAGVTAGILASRAARRKRERARG